MSDVLIIGGGAIGLLTARELLQAGAKVTIVERQLAASESSWAGGGILSPLCPWRSPEPVASLFLASRTIHPILAAQLLADTGIDPEWVQSGLLFGRPEPPDSADRWCREHAVAHRRVSPAEVATLEPDLHLDSAEPLLLPDLAQVRNPRLLRALKADVLRRGGDIREYHEVREIRRDGRRVSRVRIEIGSLTADTYVLAAGAWSALLDDRIPDRRVQVEPVKGQMLVFAPRPGLLRHVVLSGGHYLIPRRDGRILAGSTLEYCGFDKRTSDEARATLRDTAVTLLPALADQAIEKQWAGLRPSAPDGIPYIGRHPELDNLYFNCGHFRNGFATGPASTRLLADLLLDRPPSLDPTPYDPATR